MSGPEGRKPLFLMQGIGVPGTHKHIDTVTGLWQSWSGCYARTPPTSTDDAVESCFHLLILPLRLTVGLGVKTRGQADNGPKQSAEFSPEDEGELGSTVRDDINWNPVQAENMLDLAEGRLDNGMKLAILLIGRPLSVWQCGPQMGIVRSPEGCGTMRDDEAPGEAAGDQPEPGCLFAHWAGIDKFPGVFVQ